LRAVFAGLKAHAQEISSGIPAVVRLDNRKAVTYLTGWRGGDKTQPEWYDLRFRSYNHPERKPTLVALQQWVARHAGALRFEHVRGHNGDPLNEAADSLAAIGKNVLHGTYSAKDAKARATQLVPSFLMAYEKTLQ
jgi:ribonuclease HI